MIFKFLRKLLQSGHTANESSAETLSKPVSPTKNVLSEKTTTMKSTKPYLLEAMYRWMTDSGCSPLIFARTDILGVIVPEGYAKDNHIVLDIEQDSVRNFKIEQHIVTFEAMFGDDVFKVRLPMPAILGIHTEENGMGLEFHEEDGDQGAGTMKVGAGSGSEGSGLPNLHVL